MRIKEGAMKKRRTFLSEMELATGSRRNEGARKSSPVEGQDARRRTGRRE